MQLLSALPEILNLIFSSFQSELTHLGLCPGIWFTSMLSMHNTSLLVQVPHEMLFLSNWEKGSEQAENTCT